MPKTLRERRKRLLREEIIDMAQELINEHGYAAMSMDELAARVGISKPTLYGHFESKEGLVTEVVMQHMAWLVEWIEHPPADLSPLGRLAALLHTLVTMHITHQSVPFQVWSPDLARLLCDRPEALGHMERMRAGMHRLVAAAFTSGEIDPDLSHDVVLLTFFSLGTSLKQARFADPSWTLSDSSIADQLVTIFRRSVQAPSASSLAR